jgi:hypothetical protein
MISAGTQESLYWYSGCTRTAWEISPPAYRPRRYMYLRACVSALPMMLQCCTPPTRQWSGTGVIASCLGEDPVGELTNPQLFNLEACSRTDAQAPACLPRPIQPWPSSFHSFARAGAAFLSINPSFTFRRFDPQPPTQSPETASSVHFASFTCHRRPLLPPIDPPEDMIR